MPVMLRISCPPRPIAPRAYTLRLLFVVIAICSSLGLPPEAFSYLNSHGSLDLEHMDFFATLMNRLDEDDDRAAVVHTARVVYRLYGDIFRGLPLAA